jgi:hypothetical protein
MKITRSALLPLVLMPAMASAQAGTIPAPAACTEIVDTLAKSSASHRVNPSSARISSNQSYSFWINSRAGGSQGDITFKTKCVTSADGDVVSLRVE